MIIEGTSDIMHLFIAREALDPHLNKIKPLLSSHTSFESKLKALVKLGGYYPVWYLRQLFPRLESFGDIDPVLADHMHFVEWMSRRLALYTFHQMMRYQKKLESKQAILNRIVEIGTELFVMTATCSYTEYMLKNKTTTNALELADLYCHAARKRILNVYADTQENHDAQTLRVSKKVLAKEFEWLENEIIK
jgi:hypothetical protein